MKEMTMKYVPEFDTAVKQQRSVKMSNCVICNSILPIGYKEATCSNCTKPTLEERVSVLERKIKEMNE